MAAAARTPFLDRPPPMQPPKVAAGRTAITGSACDGRGGGGAAVDRLGHSPTGAERGATAAAAVAPHGGWRGFLCRAPPPPPCTSVNLGAAVGGGGCSPSPLAISGVQRRTRRRDGGGGATGRAPASGGRDRRGVARDRHLACARAGGGGRQRRRRLDDAGDGQRLQGRQHGGAAVQGEGVWEEGGGLLGGRGCWHWVAWSGAAFECRGPPPLCRRGPPCSDSVSSTLTRRSGG